jgi:hypothetical protein
VARNEIIPPKSAICLRRDLVARVVGQARVEDRSTASCSARKRSDPARVLAVLAHAHGQRLHPAEDEPGVEGTGDGAE